MRSIASGQFWLGIATSLLCLWLALRTVPFDGLSNTLAGAQYGWLLPAIVLHMLSIAARSQRWVVLLGKESRFADSFWSQGVGYLFTNVLPLRLGEPARVIVMAKRCGLPLFQVAASAIVERLLDLGTIVLFLVAILPWMQVPLLVIQAGESFGGLVLVALALLFGLMRASRRVEALLQSLGKSARFLPADSTVPRWRELVSGFSPLLQRRVAGSVFGWSLITWALGIAVYWCIIRAFQPEGALLESVFMVVALALAVTVPSSPGFIGVFQLVGQQALVLPFGAKYDSASALAITLTAHLTYYLLTTAFGVLSLSRVGESFLQLGRKIGGGRAASEATASEAHL
ncbi:MAG: flippase-like domain-containing protein [Chloroflexi bacterium]|nr:flippase-like domain-containing protein [Chloroflexota bacterium]MCL5109044.1 flippase-like domain-containing protein [Chloroflexota bacterium]